MVTVPGGLEGDWLLSSRRVKISSMARRRASLVPPRTWGEEGGGGKVGGVK